MDRCNNCKNKTKWEPSKWVREFYRPVVEYFSEVDVKRCPDCGQVYQFSFVQCFGCFVLLLLINILSNLLYIIPLIGGLASLVFPFAAYPLALEIPRHYLPWKKVKDSLLYSHWKSRLGLILAHVLGIILGAIALLIIARCFSKVQTVLTPAQYPTLD